MGTATLSQDTTAPPVWDTGLYGVIACFASRRAESPRSRCGQSRKNRAVKSEIFTSIKDRVALITHCFPNIAIDASAPQK